MELYQLLNMIATHPNEDIIEQLKKEPTLQPYATRTLKKIVEAIREKLDSNIPKKFHEIGSFYKRGKTWSYYIYEGQNEQGKKIQIGKGGFKTKKEAKLACAKYLYNKDQEGEKNEYKKQIKNKT